MFLKNLSILGGLMQRLNQAEPGQLGKISRRMAEADVNIEVLYSDHNHQLKTMTLRSNRFLQHNNCSVNQRQGSFLFVIGTLMLALSLGLDALAIEQEQRTFEGLMSTADAVVAVEILSTDYSATPADGPMVAVAKVGKVLKGPFTKGKQFRFAETAWVGPTYQKGEYRILFLENTKSREASKVSPWWILSHLYARSDFFIEKESIPDLSPESLEAFLKKIQESKDRPKKVIFGKGPPK